MSKIWFTSDTHYFHKNIAGPKVSQWSSGYRDFEDEKEMSRHIVKVFNQTVAEDDILYHLGDWSFQNSDNVWNFRKQLRCKNIHLIFGNHDQHIISAKYYQHPELQEMQNSGKIYLGSGFSVFSSVQHVLQVKHGQHQFFMSHYPHLSWHHASKGVIMLHGHEHGMLDHLNKDVRRLDVGIDTAKKLLKEYRPFSIEEVISIVENKAPLMLGHHKGQH